MRRMIALAILRERRKHFLPPHRNQSNRCENERKKYIISPLSLVSPAYYCESNLGNGVQKAARRRTDDFVQSELLVFIQCMFGIVKIDSPG